MHQRKGCALSNKSPAHVKRELSSYFISYRVLAGPKTKKASADALTSVVLFALHGAQGGTRTRTLANYPLKVACLPVPPPGHVTNCRHNNAVRRFDSAHYKEIYLTVKNFLRFFVTRHANAIDKPFLELRHKLDKNLPSSQAARPSPLKSLSGAKLSAKGCA